MEGKKEGRKKGTKGRKGTKERKGRGGRKDDIKGGRSV